MIKPFSYVFVCVLSCLSCTQTSKESLSLNDNGVPLDMANYRSTQIQDVVYHLSFAIPEEKELPIKSTLVLEATVNDLSYPLYLDFKEDPSALQDLMVNEKAITITHDKEHLIIPKEVLQLGSNTIEIEFTAGELSLNRNTNYLYTLLVPDRARTLFPCFDQPNIKASYILSITAPKNWEVLCGAPIETQKINEKTITYQFGNLINEYILYSV